LENINSLFSLFVDKPQYKIIEETFDLVKIEIELEECHIPNETALIEVLQAFPERDSISLDFYIEGSSIFSCTKKQDHKEFLDSLSRNNTEMNKRIILEIGKSFDERNTKSLYSLELLSQSLKNKNYSSLYYIFNNLAGSRKQIFFDLRDESEEFNTTKFYFKKSRNNSVYTDTSGINEISIFSKRINNCTFTEVSNYKFIPEDFFLEKRSINKELNEIFDKLCFVCSLSYICDYSHLTDSTFSFTLKGYKTLNFSLSVDNSFNEEYFRIYKWIYGESVICDKLGLARNIITLHISSNDILSLEEDVLYAIESNYSIYLKENVENYINIKNKISESLIDLFKKSSDIVNSHVKDFKQIIVGLFSYFISVILLNAIQNQNAFFSPFTTWLGLFLVVVSLFLWYISNRDLKEETTRFSSQYKLLKDRYRDLLHEKDLNRIFNNDQEFNDEKKYIEKKRKRFSIYWLFVLLFFTLIIKIFGNV